MNKFPMLNMLQGVFLLIAIVVFIGGFFLAIAAADSYSQSRDPNVIVGAIVFISTAILACGFLLVSEFITLMVRVEDHLDKIRKSLKQSAGTEDIELSHLAIASKDDIVDLDALPDKTNLIFNVKSHRLSLYTKPLFDADLLETVNNPKYVKGLRRDGSSLWLYVKLISDNQAVYGWVKRDDLDDKFDRIQDLELDEEYK